jgi:hypothetical protein
MQRQLPLHDHRRVEAQPWPRPVADPHDAELARVRVNPAAIDAKSSSHLGGGQ